MKKPLLETQDEDEFWIEASQGFSPADFEYSCLRHERFVLILDETCLPRLKSGECRGCVFNEQYILVKRARFGEVDLVPRRHATGTGENMINSVRLFLGLTGSFLAAEGGANLLFWHRRGTCLLFQCGRTIRLCLGVALIIIGFVGGA